MKSFLLRLVLCAVWSAVALRGADDAIFSAVRAADDERTAATIAGDAARLAVVYSDDLRYVHSSGKVDDKAAHLAGIAGRANAYQQFDYQARDFRLVGPGVVMMSGRVVIHSTDAQGPHQNDVIFLAVWREEKGRWRFLAWQATRNPPPAPAKK